VLNLKVAAAKRIVAYFNLPKSMWVISFFTMVIHFI